MLAPCHPSGPPTPGQPNAPSLGAHLPRDSRRPGASKRCVADARLRRRRVGPSRCSAYRWRTACRTGGAHQSGMLIVMPSLRLAVVVVPCPAVGCCGYLCRTTAGRAGGAKRTVNRSTHRAGRAARPVNGTREECFLPAGGGCDREVETDVVECFGVCLDGVFHRQSLVFVRGRVPRGRWGEIRWVTGQPGKHFKIPLN